MVVTSLLFCLHSGWGVIKGELAWASGLSSGILVALHSVTFHEEPHTLSCSCLSASWGVRLQLDREVFFICSTVSAQGYLGHPKLVCFSCLQVSQVSCHPASLGPGIRVARIAIFWCELACRMNCDFDEPINPFSIPMSSHIYKGSSCFWHKSEQESHWAYGTAERGAL